MKSRLSCLVGLVAAATACGSGSSSGQGAPTDSDVLGVIQAAAHTTAAAHSMRVHGTLAEHLEGVTATAGSPPANVDIAATFSGDMQTKPLEADLTMSGVSTNGQSISGDITELVTPDGFFMKMPQLTAQTGKAWIEMKFSDMKAMSGLDLKQVIAQAQQMQPAQYIKQLAAAGNVREVGRDTVNGTATTHYSGTVSLADMLAHYSPDVRAQFAPVLHSAGFTGSRLDAWLDAKGLVRRIHTATLGGKGSVTLSLDVLAYGVTVDVTPPPAGDVADFGRLLGNSTGG